MHLDTIELKWSYLKNVTNQNAEWFELVGYKSITESLEDFLNTHQDIQSTYNEKDMQSKWENIFQNWITPKTASGILKLFYENNSKLYQL